MDGFNQGCPGGHGDAISVWRPKPRPPFLTAASPQTPLPMAPFLLSGLLSVLCPAFCDLIFFPSVHPSSIYHPLSLHPHPGPPEAFQRLGPQPRASLPHWPPLKDALPQVYAPSSVTVHRVTAASCLAAHGEGGSTPLFSGHSCSLAPIHSFIHSLMPTHSIREECWGLCQEPCIALCWGH